uniref:Uncharacterized protein n=1 Tax=Panagrolaimus superbus TaxID=310955 RepID=A0A914YH20_9BILA
MIEVLFHVRKEKFVSYPSIVEELDLIEEEDQVCHLVHIISEDDKPLDPETGLNIFKYDPNFEETEKQYDEIRREIIGDADDSDDEEGEEDGAQPAAGEDGDEAEDTAKPLVSMKIVDMTEAEQAAFRRKVYLTIQSSLDFQEAAHKLIKNIYKPGIEVSSFF